MKISPIGRALISRYEGEVLKVYVDPVGVKTAGKGATGREIDALPVGSKVTKKQSDIWFNRDVAEVEEILERHIKVEVSQEMVDSLGSLVFNIGQGNFSKSTLLKRLNQQDYVGASKEFPRWAYAKKKKLPGLVRRRLEEQALFMKGIDQEHELESNIEADEEKYQPSMLKDPKAQSVAAVSTAAVLQEQASKVEALAPYSEWMLYLFIALTVGALIYTLRARKDD